MFNALKTLACERRPSSSPSQTRPPCADVSSFWPETYNPTCQEERRRAVTRGEEVERDAALLF